jgi:hypothetical protein
MGRFDSPQRGDAKHGGSIRDVWAVLNKFFAGGFLTLTADRVRGRVSKFGTGTIASGTTSVAVTHGAAYTPTIDMIRVTFSENPTNDPGNSWVSAIGATQFTVNVRADPGASGLDFGWAVVPL